MFQEREVSYGKTKYNSFFTKRDPEERENAGRQKGYFFKPAGPRIASDDC
jgi:hypothetical protein